MNKDNIVSNLQAWKGNPQELPSELLKEMLDGAYAHNDDVLHWHIIASLVMPLGNIETWVIDYVRRYPRQSLRLVRLLDQAVSTLLRNDQGFVLRADSLEATYANLEMILNDNMPSSPFFGGEIRELKYLCNAVMLIQRIVAQQNAGRQHQRMLYRFILQNDPQLEQLKYYLFAVAMYGTNELFDVLRAILIGSHADRLEDILPDADFYVLEMIMERGTVEAMDRYFRCFRLDDSIIMRSIMMRSTSMHSEISGFLCEQDHDFRDEKLLVIFKVIFERGSMLLLGNAISLPLLEYNEKESVMLILDYLYSDKVQGLDAYYAWGGCFFYDLVASSYNKQLIDVLFKDHSKLIIYLMGNPQRYMAPPLKCRWIDAATMPITTTGFSIINALLWLGDTRVLKMLTNTAREGVKEQFVSELSSNTSGNDLLLSELVEYHVCHSGQPNADALFDMVCSLSEAEFKLGITQRIAVKINAESASVAYMYLFCDWVSSNLDLSPFTDKISEIKRSFLTERSAGSAILMSKLVFSNNHTFRALAKEQYKNARDMFINYTSLCRPVRKSLFMNAFLNMYARYSILPAELKALILGYVFEDKYSEVCNDMSDKKIHELEYIAAGYQSEISKSIASCSSTNWKNLDESAESLFKIKTGLLG